jgi:hypothetical protein
MNTDPQDAPATTLAADNETVLKRFRVDAVIYAPSRIMAQRRLSQASLYLDYAALQPDEGE